MTDPQTDQSFPGEPQAQAEPLPFRRIVVGVDFSPSSQQALEVARGRFAGAELRLVHGTDARATATPDLMGGVTPAMPDAGLLRALEQAEGGRLAALTRPGETTEHMVGDPVTGLLDAAAAWNADLIVVGTHARGALEHLLLGSTAEKVVARSPVPVLTVRHTGSGG